MLSKPQLSIAFLAGMITSDLIDGAPAGLAIHELSRAEHEQRKMFQTIPPMYVYLRFESKKDWAADTHAQPSSVFSTTLGYASYTLDGSGGPCTVVLPAGWTIVASPMWAKAQFDPDDSAVLAHEILHCIRGAWHDGRK